MPETVTVVLFATGTVATVKVVVDVFAATVTLAGTPATEALLVLRVTTAPPAGAMPLSVTVAVDEVPPVTVTGLTVRLFNVGGTTVSVAVCVAPL